MYNVSYISLDAFQQVTLLGQFPIVTCSSQTGTSPAHLNRSQVWVETSGFLDNLSSELHLTGGHL